MLPKSLSELEEIRKECKYMVVKRAVVSGAANLVPIPGLDIAADVGLLMQLLPAINNRFGLSPEQIEKLDPQTRAIVYGLVVNTGTQLAGKVITKQLIVTILKRVGIRVGARQVAKFIPIIGQGTALAISVAAMKTIGDMHVDECYNIAMQAIKTGRAA